MVGWMGGWLRQLRAMTATNMVMNGKLGVDGVDGGAVPENAIPAQLQSESTTSVVCMLYAHSSPGPPFTGGVRVPSSPRCGMIRGPQPPPGL